MSKIVAFSLSRAEELALKALTFLAEDTDRLVRFLSLTGTTPDSLRAGAGQPQMLAAVLGHLLEDERLLVAFANEKALDPTSIAPAHALLSRAAEA